MAEVACAAILITPSTMPLHSLQFKEAVGLKPGGIPLSPVRSSPSFGSKFQSSGLKIDARGSSAGAGRREYGRQSFHEWNCKSDRLARLATVPIVWSPRSFSYIEGFQGPWAKLKQPMMYRNLDMMKTIEFMKKGCSELTDAYLRQAEWSISDNQNNYEIRVALPGYSARDVTIEIKRNRILSIRASPGDADTMEGEGATRYPPIYFRNGLGLNLAIPRGIERKSIAAELKNGLLTVTIPKLTDEESAVYQVRVHEGQDEEPQEVGKPEDPQVTNDAEGKDPAAEL